MPKGKILVTGGTGYIGSHTVCQLLSGGFDVISVDNLSNSYEDVNDRIREITGKSPFFYSADLCDPEQVSRIFKLHPDIDCIIHFAALKSVGESVMFPLRYYRNNILSLINLLDISSQYNIRSVVFSSSCTVYGQPDSLPVKEDTPLKEPMSPYGKTKKICEDILQDFSQIFSESKIICLRYFNPVGAHSSGLIGELPIGTPNNLMPFITQTAYGIRDKLSVFGGDYNTPDGTAIRDYIHVMDLADAHLKAMERMMDNRMKQSFELFNLGTGEGYSVLQMIHAFMEATGVQFPYEITGRRAGDIEQIWADCSLANTELMWKTNLTLNDMMSDAWRWEKYYRNSLTSHP